jgi:hypothetical protein
MPDPRSYRQLRLRYRASHHRCNVCREPDLARPHSATVRTLRRARRREERQGEGRAPTQATLRDGQRLKRGDADAAAPAALQERERDHQGDGAAMACFLRQDARGGCELSPCRPANRLGHRRCRRVHISTGTRVVRLVACYINHNLMVMNCPSTAGRSGLRRDCPLEM